MKNLKNLLCFLLFISNSTFAEEIQEKIIFHPYSLPLNEKFNFPDKFQEIFLGIDNNHFIHGLHFPNPKQTKGAILFLHGNAQTVKEWGNYYKGFLNLGYDFYIFDYRGYGKSKGYIKKEEDLYQDCSLMFEHILKKFPNEKINLVAYSLGTGLAANLSSKYRFKNLILFAPYSSLEDLIIEKASFIPKVIIKYKIPTKNFLKQNKADKVIIFHGIYDSLIPKQHSLELKKFLKSSDNLFLILATHNNLLEKKEVWDLLKNFL